MRATQPDAVQSPMTRLHLSGNRRALGEPRLAASLPRLRFRCYPHLQRRLRAILILLCLPLPGCTHLLGPDTAAPVLRRAEPEQGGRYFLYVPSSYDRTQAWPLVVVCHGAFPDSPEAQIQAWADLAESRGFLLAAPALTSAVGLSAPKAAKQLPRLRRDEAHVLGIVQHVRGGYTISDDRIVLYGWTGGAVAALHIALRHPDLFRAVAVVQPKFDAAYFVEADNNVDHAQPVYLHYGANDSFTGKHGRRCAEYLRQIGVDLHDTTIGTPRAEELRGVVSFYERVIREPWVRIAMHPGPSGNPRERRFVLHSNRSVSRYRWSFGDGDESPVAEPTHTYAEAGAYAVSVMVYDDAGRKHTRTLDVLIP